MASLQDEPELGIPLEDVPAAREGGRVEEPEGQQVDIQQAVKEFEHTKAEIQSVLVSVDTPEFIEQQAGFDLNDFLESSVRARDAAGIKRKRMGVVFKELTVVGEGADATSIANLWSPIEKILNLVNPLNWVRKRRQGTDFDILHNLTGFCKDGEMLLVLGRPGAGCSTLLRVLANQTDTYKAITGDVTYGGIPASDFGRYLGEAIYTAEEDVHYPGLTVRQTLTAALKCKVPHTRVSEQTRQVFVDKVMNMLLSMFGLQKQVDTIVGNEFVRGLSGGERKRLTIAEAMTAQAAVNCWDCCTRGLDAASALDYTRSLRIMSDTLQKTTICSLYQASEDIYNLFDKVLLLDKGRCIYFGPVTKAKQYFEDMGFNCEFRKTTPDFLTGITNPNERKVKVGFEDKVPQTAAEMEAAYNSSETRKEMAHELADYEKFVEEQQPAKDFREHVKEAKAGMMSKRSVYTTNFFTQTRVLLKREFQLIWGDKGALYGRAFSVLSKSFVYSTLFLFMALNSEGAFQRGGALFTGLLFNAMMSLSELPSALKGRRVLQKHKSYAMYRPSAYHVSSVIADIPLNGIQVTLFCCISYFFFGLDLRADKFFIFMFTIILSCLTMTEVFRLAANISNTYFAASQIANVILVLSLAYTGYIIPYHSMHPWFIWIYWINPMAYAFKAIFSNEMHGLIFPCEGAGAVPYGPTYTDAAYKACVLAGQTGSELNVRGENYLSTFGYNTAELPLDVMALVLFWILFIFLNCMLMEYYELSKGGYTRQVYKKGKAPKQNDASATVVTQEDEGLQVAGDKEDLEAPANTTFTWQHMRYTVPIKGGSKLLLDNVEGWIKPGQMTALMGVSGAGKTTLLDVLAKRKTIGVVEGDILLNGTQLKIDFERLTGYVEQMDVHQPGQTVREALRFSARMRQDPSVSLEDKYDYVEKILKMMEMSHLGDALVGDLESGRGISVEERKRLTIGLELVGKPKILFLDEPTSGLDAQSSYNIVKFIRKLADQGMPLVCTIHQPSSVLFEYFDRLLLLARGGRTVYFGDIGKNSRVLLDYFETNGADKCQTDENPAEYILRAIGAGINATTTKDWAQIWKNSPQCNDVHEELARIRSSASSAGSGAKEHREYATSEATQFLEVYKRMNLLWWRDPIYNYGRLLNAIFIGLINGFSFWKLGSNLSDLQARVFVVFQVLILGNSLITLAQPMFMRQRTFFRKEYASKFYGWRPFAFSIVVTELPYLAIASAIFMFISYWTVGLESTDERNAYYYLVFVAFMWFTVSFGQVIASFCQSVAQASTLNPFFIPFLIIFAGVVCPPSVMPTFWKSWMYPVDPYHYFLEGIVTDVLHDKPVVCDTNELIRIPLNPTFATCGEYMQEFFKYGTGYIANPDATDTCNYCRFSNGTEFYSQFEWTFDNRWRNFGLLLAYFSFNIGLCVFFVWLYRKPKR